MNNFKNTIDGFPIYHEGNHNKFGNPHPQYLLSKDYKSPDPVIVSNNTNNNGKYVKLFRIKFKWLTANHGFSLSFKLISESMNNNGRAGEVFLKAVSKNNTVSSEIYINTTGNLNPENLYALETIDTFRYIDLYVKLDSNILWINDILLKDNSVVNLEVPDEYAVIDLLPEGNYIKGTQRFLSSVAVNNKYISKTNSETILSKEGRIKDFIIYGNSKYYDTDGNELDSYQDGCTLKSVFYNGEKDFTINVNGTDVVRTFPGESLNKVVATDGTEYADEYNINKRYVYKKTRFFTISGSSTERWVYSSKSDASFLCAYLSKTPDSSIYYKIMNIDGGIMPVNFNYSVYHDGLNNVDTVKSKGIGLSNNSIQITIPYTDLSSVTSTSTNDEKISALKTYLSNNNIKILAILNFDSYQYGVTVNDIDYDTESNFTLTTNIPTDFSYSIFNNLDLSEALNRLPAGYAYVFDNVSDMKNTNIPLGSMATTKGYYKPNDGGAGEYEIVDDSSLVDDGGSILSLDNGLFAKLIVKDGVVNIRQFGARPDEVSSSNIINAVSYATDMGLNNIYIPSGTYLIDVNYPIIVPNNFRVYGDGFSSILKADRSTYHEITDKDVYNSNSNSILCAGYIYSSSGDATIKKNVIIENLCVDGDFTESTLEEISAQMNWDNNTNYYNNGFGIFVGYGGCTTISNVKVVNTMGSGIYLDRNYETIVDKCFIYNCANGNKTSGSKNGISMTGINDGKYKGNTVSNSIISSCKDEGIQYAYTPVTIVNNHILNNKDCAIEGDTSYPSSDTDKGDVIIIGNQCIGNRHSIGIGNVSNQKIIIENNILKGNTDFVISVVQSGGKLIISNNIISDSTTSEGTNLIYCQIESCKITGNTISDCTATNAAIFCTLGEICNIESNHVYRVKSRNLAYVKNPDYILKDNDFRSVDSEDGVNCFICLGGKYVKSIYIKDNIFRDGVKNLLKNEVLSDAFDIASLKIEGNSIINCCEMQESMIRLSNGTLTNTISYLSIKDNVFYKSSSHVDEILTNYVYLDSGFTVSNLVKENNCFPDSFISGATYSIANNPANVDLK